MVSLYNQGKVQGLCLRSRLCLPPLLPGPVPTPLPSLPGPFFIHFLRMNPHFMVCWERAGLCVTSPQTVSFLEGGTSMRILYLPNLDQGGHSCIVWVDTSALKSNN